ncbi:MAG: sulfite exporter TauE/SafE family protein [Chloroflexi bacterium]|nr:sulfite exporter TauE/SafE family protein [Chloroflexota bacterium]
MGTESLLVSFVTGLLGSLGHCIGMCGSIVAAYALSRRPAQNADIGTRLRAPLALHAGRLTTYGLLGAGMGVAGSLVDLMANAAGWQGLLSIVAGLMMLFVGLRLVGLLPSGEIAPTVLFRSLRVGERLARLLRDQSPWSSLGIGLLWGLFPCGLVFAMLVNAAATGSALGGASAMLAFGLGTVPALLGLSLVTAKIAVQFRQRLLRFAALPVLLLAVQAILRGLAAEGLISSLIIGGVMLW